MKKIHTIKLTKSLRSAIIVTLLTIFSFSLYILPTYASDLPELNSGSSEADVISNESIDEIAETIILVGSENEQDKGYSKIGNSTLKEEIVSEIKASTATEYTTTDIYNFLYSAMRGQSTGTTYSLPFIARLLNTIRDEVHGSSVFASNPITLYEYIQEMSAGNSDWSYAAGPIQVMAGTIANELDYNQITPESNALLTTTIKDFICMMWNDISSINDVVPTSLPSIESKLDTLSSQSFSANTKLSTINTTINNTTNTINNSIGNVNNSIASVDQNISGLRTDLSIDAFTSYDATPQVYINETDLWQSGTYQTYYVKFNLPNYVAPVSRIFIPINRGSLTVIYNTPNIKFMSLYNGAFVENNNIEYTTIATRFGVYIYYIGSYTFYNNPLYIQVSSEIPMTYISSSTITYEYILRNHKDYREWVEFIRESNQFNNIEKITNVYASDDIIAQKEAQKPTETQALDDFTGNGSESMSVGNVIDVKGVSSTVKSTLNAGGSINNALNILNANNNMWQWFTNTTKNNINGNNLRKSNSNNSDEYISIYQQNLSEYWQGLGIDDKSN